MREVKFQRRSGAGSRKQAALPKETLHSVFATSDESVHGLRDRALLQFAWSTGGRRRLEVAKAT